MGLDLYSQLLQVLDDGAVNCAAKICVVVSDRAGLVANGVVSILQAPLSEELVAGTEGDLNDRAELRHLLRRVVLDVRDALALGQYYKCTRPVFSTHLKVSYELLHNRLPSDEALDEHVGRLKVVGCNVLSDESRVPAGGASGLSGEGGVAGYSDGLVAFHG